jgi:SH3-like domain-containing protein
MFCFRSLLVGASALALMTVAGVLAQDVVQPPAVENSKYQVQGLTNGGPVNVRSGPGEGYYATQMLDKGAAVTVVGIKFDWLKIVPPDGSFSYVGSVFVDRSPDGTTGKINRADVNIRAGSQLNASKTTVQTRLGIGDTVQILGKEDEYLRIKPPAGAYLYVKKDFVEIVKAQTGTASLPTDSAGGTAPANPASNSDPTSKLPKATAPIIQTPDVITTATPASATTMPTTAPSQTASAATTQPGATAAAAAPPPPTAEELFGKYEQEFTELSKQPLAEQSLDDLTAKYQAIEKSTDLSDELKRVVQLRLATLAGRSQSQTKLLAARKIEKEAAQKQLVLQAEQQELAERLKQTEVEIFAAVGTLEPSSLQVGGGTLYRLTDPDSGRTMIYIRSADAKIADMIGKFVGVKGEATTDSQLSLRVITPSDIEPVDPAKVNGSVAAEIIPPSLLARQASASSTGN